MDDAGRTARRGSGRAGTEAHLEGVVTFEPGPAPAPLEWDVRAGRGQPARARLALALWGFVTAAWFALGPRGYALVFVALGLYLVGPLWTPAHYRIDDAGVTRRSPFGATVLPWDALLAFALAKDGGAAWLWRRGRGTARFLPPVLLLWDEAATPGLGAAVAVALSARLPRRDESAR